MGIWLLTFLLIHWVNLCFWILGNQPPRWHVLSLAHAHVPRSVPHDLALLFSFPLLVQISFHAHLAFCAKTIVRAPFACFPIFHITLINCLQHPLLHTTLNSKAPSFSMCTHPFSSRQRFSTLLIQLPYLSAEIVFCKKLYICTYSFHLGQRFQTLFV